MNQAQKINTMPPNTTNMSSEIKISTWNLCLGLFHKKDYVKAIIHKYNIDILNLQETELKEGLNEKTLNIPGYSLETEKSKHANGIRYLHRSYLASTA